jgi:hypothetical protein
MILTEMVAITVVADLNDPVASVGSVLEEVNAHTSLDILVLADDRRHVVVVRGNGHIQALSVHQKGPFVLI